MSCCSRASPSPAAHVRTHSPLHHLCTPRQQVRSIAVGDIGIITGSRDTTIKIWADDAPDTCSLLNTLVGRRGGWCDQGPRANSSRTGRQRMRARRSMVVMLGPADCALLSCCPAGWQQELCGCSCLRASRVSSWAGEWRSHLRCVAVVQQAGRATPGWCLWPPLTGRVVCCCCCCRFF